MAGSSSNWFKASSGPYKGRSVYLSKGQQERLKDDFGLSRVGIQGVLSNPDRAPIGQRMAIEYIGDRERPAGAAKPRQRWSSLVDDVSERDAAEAEAKTAAAQAQAKAKLDRQASEQLAPGTKISIFGSTGKKLSDATVEATSWRKKYLLVSEQHQNPYDRSQTKYYRAVDARTRQIAIFSPTWDRDDAMRQLNRMDKPPRRMAMSRRERVKSLVERNLVKDFDRLGPMLIGGTRAAGVRPTKDQMGGDVEVSVGDRGQVQLRTYDRGSQTVVTYDAQVDRRGRITSLAFRSGMDRDDYYGYSDSDETGGPRELTEAQTRARISPSRRGGW